MRIDAKKMKIKTRKKTKNKKPQNIRLRLINFNDTHQITEKQIDSFSDGPDVKIFCFLSHSHTLVISF